MLGPMGGKLPEGSARALEFALVVLGLVPGDGLERGPGQFRFLNLVGGGDLLGEFGLGTKGRVGQDTHGDDDEPEPDGQIILFFPQIRPLAFAVIDDDVAVLGHGCFSLLS